ncbi:organic cation transporter protein-like [Saccoglossus kowalevskii]|uniref:Organic cation transporter protein-like n=1 Tax=Saccoglossus kowalevskii TaxID=10224 RepID=A0ABM0MP45_SACKO|nr:PREDICTED: organic cation transporter protein-like [Saccoglossus kowalevskii]
MQLDEAYKVVGECGFYHFSIYILVCIFGQVISVWHMLGITFLGGTPLHHCWIPDWATLNDSIPLVESDDGTWEYSSCTMYDNYTASSNSTVSCEQGWVYDPSHELTIVTEWDLVCDKSAYVDISQAIFMTGVMFGSVTFGQLSDIFGRRPVWFLSLWVQLVIAVSVAFTQSYAAFTILRFFVGFLEQGVDITAYVMVTEMFTPKWRTYAGVNLTIFWAIGIMILPMMASSIDHWRYLQLAISLPAVLSIPLWWIVPETPRWLLSKARVVDAEKILQKIGRRQRRNVPDNILTDEANYPPINMQIVSSEGVVADEARDSTNTAPEDKDSNKIHHLGTIPVHIISDDGDSCKHSSEVHSEKNTDNNSIESTDENKDTKKYNITDLFRTPTVRMYSLIMIFVWMVNSLVYYGLSLNTDLLAGNKYFNFFLSGAVEIPAYILSAFAIDIWGRRIPLCTFHIIGGVACILTGFIPEETSDGTDLSTLVVVIAMTGKFGIAGSFAIVFLYSTELFPTVIRNLGVGASSFSSRIGGILAPLIVLLEAYVSGLPLLIFGVLSVAAGLLVLVLPETKGRVQPKTIEDVETR